MLDFNKVNKKFLSIQLTDGTKLLVKMPNKRMYDTLFRLKDAMCLLDREDIDVDVAMQTLDEIYMLIAEILSNNIGGRQITADYLAGIFDVEDIQIFFTSYLGFVTGRVAADPNGSSLTAQTNQAVRENTDTAATQPLSASSMSTQG